MSEAVSNTERTLPTDSERVARWLDTGWEKKMVYEEDIPSSLSTVEVTTVVPVSGELANGNFWRLLRSAAEQTLDAHKYEMILVVNNSYELSQTDSERFKDNQDLLFIARELQKATARVADKKMSAEAASSAAITNISQHGIDISDSQAQLFMKAVSRGCRFYAIDASSEDRAPLKRNQSHTLRGTARHIGGKVAYRRFFEHNKNASGLIDFIDADCAFPPNYYEKIIETRSKNKSKSFFAKELVTFAPDIPDWSELPPLGRLAHLVHYLRRNITDRRRQYLTSNRYRHGPAPIASGDLFRKVGGYPTDVFNEDFAFAENLASHEKPAFVQGTHIRLSDRTSDLAVDGATWKSEKVSEGNRNDLESFAKAFDPKNISTLESGRYRYYVSDVLNIDAAYESNVGYRNLRTKRWAVEVEKSKRRVAVLRLAVRSVVEKIHSLKPRLETFTKGQAFRRWLRKHMGDSLDAKMIDVLAENPIVVASLVTVARFAEDNTSFKKLGVREGASATENVWNFFEKYLPEYFVELGPTEPDYKGIRTSFSKDGVFPQGYSLAHFTHLVLAQHDWEVANNF